MKHFIYTIAIIGTCLASAPSFAEEASITQLRKDAEKGNVDAQFDLAMAYHDGTNGLPSDDTEAVKWFRKAAEQNDIGGEFNLAIAYYHGFGVKKDMNESVKWFKKAAEQGYGEAEYILASAYQNGLGGLQKDLVQSDYWLALAEAQGNIDAGRERIALEGTMTDDAVTRAKVLIDTKKIPPATPRQ